jgi:hypothetical protein
MTRYLSLSILCAVSVFLFVSEISAQENEPPPPSSTESAEDEKEANPGSQEVEYSEDNYRRFMELKDQNLQKSSLPTNKYQSGTQKLDELPESSQKHLRNQLREVIVQEGAWTPGDENKDYPYVPSEAAEGNAGLKQQEAEAWQELVGEYHEREALIHANAARSDAAGAAAQAGNQTGGSATTQAGSGGPGGNEGANEGSQGAGKQGKLTGQEQQGTQDRNEGGYSPGSAAQQGDPNAGSTAGVSQNAMEFLMKNGGLETGKEHGSAGAPPGGEAQGGMTAPAGQENSTGQEPTADSIAATTAAGQTVQEETNSQSTAGASQNAMDFLTKKGGSETGNEVSTDTTTADNNAQGTQTGQAGQENPTGQEAAADSSAMTVADSQPVQEDPGSQSTDGSSQNAMEYLTGSESQDSTDATTSASPMDPDGDFEVVSKGTLSIKDLSNAKGVTSPTQGNLPATPPDEAKEKDKKDDGPQ